MPPGLRTSRNRSFQDYLPDTKWYYLEYRSSGILRKVAMFAQAAYQSKGVQDAIADFIENDMTDI